MVVYSFSSSLGFRQDTRRKSIRDSQPLNRHFLMFLLFQQQGKKGKRGKKCENSRFITGKFRVRSGYNTRGICRNTQSYCAETLPCSSSVQCMNEDIFLFYYLVISYASYVTVSLQHVSRGSSFYKRARLSH